MLVDQHSLSKTLDNVNDLVFWGKPIDESERLEASRWIAGQYEKPRNYRGLFAPTDQDYNNGIRLFTGERITSGAGTAHILSEEAGRALLLLGSDINESVRQTLLSMISVHDQPNQPWGLWCCGTCSASLWRHLAAGGGDQQEERMINGLKDLTRCRNDNGRWRKYPFYYTVLSLTEMNVNPAINELRYAGKAIENAWKRSKQKSQYDARRKELLERALKLI